MCHRGRVTDAGDMHPTDLAPLALLLVPIASFVSIVTSPTIVDRTPRILLRTLGWIGWVASVAALAFVGLVAVGFGCWGATTNNCGERESSMILFGGLVALAIPAAVQQVVAARVSSRGNPSDPRPPR